MRLRRTKMNIAFFVFSLLVLTVTNCLSQQSDFPKRAGSYFGQKPPGMTPEIFAPGIISIQESAEYGCNFSPDHNEMYFTRNSSSTRAKIWVSKKINNKWSEPSIVEFMDEFPGSESCISPDGEYFFYVRVNKIQETFEQDIYKVVKTEHGWNGLTRLTDIDLGNRRISPSVASNGNLYFSGDYDKPGQKDIYVSEFINGNYSLPINLGEEVNSEFDESHVFVAPDERYILFDSHRPNENGKTDIYISVKTNVGLWSKALNIGPPVNSEYSDWYPTVTPDGKYLMFSRNIDRAADIMRVDVKIIDELRSKE